jgi:hypothetical protein
MENEKRIGEETLPENKYRSAEDRAAWEKQNAAGRDVTNSGTAEEQRAFEEEQRKRGGVEDSKR